MSTRDLLKQFADSSQLGPDTLQSLINAGFIGYHEGTRGYKMTTAGSIMLAGGVGGPVRPPGDSASCPDDDSYLAPKRGSYPDMVNQPPHYTAGGIECIDAIRAALTPEEFRGFCKGNAIKYSWREKLKGGDEDLKKAAWYLAKVSE